MTAGEEPPRQAQVADEPPPPGPDREETPAPAPPPALPSPDVPQPMPGTGPIDIGSLWARVLRAQGLPTVLRTLMTYLRPMTVDPAAGRVVLAGSLRHVESARGRQVHIVEVFRRELGRAVEVAYHVDDADPEAAEDPVAGPEEPASEPSPRPEPPLAGTPARPEPRVEPAQISQHPLVKEAMELFGARIVDIQHRRPGG